MTTPIRVLYVANRGEIARRIATTASRLGIRAVVPDLEAPGAPDLLSAIDVVRSAVAAGADAVHPGYGFLAESPELAGAVLAAGLTWVGPPADAIRRLGDKAEARAMARACGVPVAEGDEPADQSDASLADAASRVGFPLVLKPAAGGGGKGIRVVAAAGELQAALAATRREARRAFGDERLLLERYVVGARHVEVQVFADAHGGVVHFGDRDCSLQRRHQKVLEEAPAPALEPGVRAALWDAAVRLATAVGYVGAGTCEFLVGEDGSFVFLEMNARLQVEHPVTELVLRRDLVGDQLAIAGGARLAELGLDRATVEAALEAGGHAVEVRLNAEDPAQGFLPSAGRVVALRWPGAAAAFGPVGPEGIRVDAGVEAGDRVGGAFDPLLAKVIAHGPDRATALDRLAAALDATELLGLPTNLAFLRRLVRLAVVREGRARTETLEADPEARAAATARPDLPDAASSLAAGMLAKRGPAGAWGGGWRMNAAHRIRLVAAVGDDLVARVVELPAAPWAAPDEEEAAFGHRDGDAAHVSVEGADVVFRLQPPPELGEAPGRGAASAAGGPGSAASVHAPMPGAVIAVHVAAGRAIAAGERIVTLEAMKMEHDVVAPVDGRVDRLLVAEGEQVERGQPLATLEPAP